MWYIIERNSDMRLSVQVVHDLLSSISPADEREELDRADALRWTESTDDIFRRVKPAVPDRHLVVYLAMIDRSDGSSLLVDHLDAGLWLPAGGHAEPDEHPAETARREAWEELGIELAEEAPPPVFITATPTVGHHAGHVDVGLWYLLVGQREMSLSPGVGEFREVRWWTKADLAAVDPALLDPHWSRFSTKVADTAPGWPTLAGAIRGSRIPARSRD